MQIFLPLRIFFVSLVFACVSCATMQAPTTTKSQQELQSGIKSYEDGDYKTATKQLQTSLELGLNSKSEQGSAHKYLAFIYCTSSREKACREEFRKAFESDPNFDLQPAEVGHPIWGPVFRSVKGEMVGKVKPK